MLLFTSFLLFVPIEVAQERNVEGDLFLWDMGEGLGFRSGTFDGVIRFADFIRCIELQTFACTLFLFM